MLLIQLLCMPLQLCASIHPLSRQCSFPFFGTRQKDFGFPKAKTTNKVRDYHGMIAGASTYNRLERRHRTGFFRGVGKKVEERQTTERHTNPHRREFVAVLLWVSRPWAKLVGVSRDTRERARKSECRLGLVVPLEPGRLAASGKGGFRGRRGRAGRLVVLRAARPRGPGPTICRGLSGFWLVTANFFFD